MLGADQKGSITRYGVVRCMWCCTAILHIAAIVMVEVLQDIKIFLLHISPGIFVT